MTTKNIFTLLFSGFVLGFGVKALASHHESPKPRTRNGIEFVSGGVGVEQEKAMRRMANDYSMQLTIIRPDGRYLAKVDVKILDASGKEVLALGSAGPMVLADLKPGRYQIKVTEDGRTQERTANVQATDNTSVVVAIAESA